MSSGDISQISSSSKRAVGEISPAPFNNAQFQADVRGAPQFRMEPSSDSSSVANAMINLASGGDNAIRASQIRQELKEADMDIDPPSDMSSMSAPRHRVVFRTPVHQWVSPDVAGPVATNYVIRHVGATIDGKIPEHDPNRLYWPVRYNSPYTDLQAAIQKYIRAGSLPEPLLALVEGMNEAVDEMLRKDRRNLRAKHKKLLQAYTKLKVCQAKANKKPRRTRQRVQIIQQAPRMQYMYPMAARRRSRRSFYPPFY